MALSRSHAQPLKSLNKSPGRKRFVFKNFSQRLEEVEIDVFRSLNPLKPEPEQGSSFFRDSLLHWRELSTAEDFITFYEEMMPWVQTLPQILLHKETIVSKLFFRLRMEARLSLEPILRLIAALSRDLQEDFLPFLARFIDSLVSLFENGGDRDPEILEQVFTSLSYIMMYLRKYLIQGIIHVLKITEHLSYYPRDYVQEFMAEAVSFLLRNAPIKQLGKGIQFIMSEVVKSSSTARKAGVSALLWHAMKGTSSRLHSRAKQVLHLLMDDPVPGISGEATQSVGIVVEVLTGAFERLCEELQPKEVSLVLDCLFEKISGCINKIEKDTDLVIGQDDGCRGSKKCMLHLNYLLSLLIFTVRSINGSKVLDLQSLLELVGLLIKAFITHSGTVKLENDYSCEVVNSILQLMLGVLDIPRVADDSSAILSISMQWASVFKIRNSSFLHFIQGLLLKDSRILYLFRSYIMSAMSDWIESSSSEVLYLMLTFVDRLQGKVHFSDRVDDDSEENASIICHFFHKTILSQIQVITRMKTEGFPSTMKIPESELAVMWATICCCPHVFVSRENISSLMDLVNALDQLLMIEADNIAGHARGTWQCLLGAALASYQKLLLNDKMGLSELTSDFLLLAKRNKSSSHILSVVADSLDSIFGCPGNADASRELFHAELAVEKAIDAIYMFSDNLSLPDKDIRVSTLRLLCHYVPLDCQPSDCDQHAPKKLKTEGSGSCHGDTPSSNVIQLLLSIEATPHSISTSRQVINMISRLQMDLTAARIPEAYVSLLLNGIIGIFHNRFGLLWVPAADCLATLLERHADLVWDAFVQYLKNYQFTFLSSHEKLQRLCSEYTANDSNDLGVRFRSFVSHDSDSTPSVMVLTLLLQSIQKAPAIIEPHSRQIIPLFFKFLGYAHEDILSIGAFDSHIFKGKEWRTVLKEWLNLLKLMRNPRSLYRSNMLKEVLTSRLLDETDPDIQLRVVDCLLNWKDGYLLPYDQNLKNLIASKNLREELTTWTLSKESGLIPEAHREYLIPSVIRILTPKVRNAKALASRKHAGTVQRRAVLSFLAQLEVNELPLFFFLLLKPMHSISSGSEGFVDQVWSSCESFVQYVEASDFVKRFIVRNTVDLPWKKRSGFLHVIEDVLKTFDECHIKPFISLLMAFVVRILESCTSSLASVRSDESSVTNIVTKQAKDLRSLCLKVLSLVFNKYDSHDLGDEFWDIFFVSVKPLIDNFKQEACSSEKPSSLFSCFSAMSKSPKLVWLLEREENLIRSIFSILSAKNASDAMVSAVLSFIENLLNLDRELVDNESGVLQKILVPRVDELLQGLHGLIQCRKEGYRKSITWPGRTELSLLKLLATYISEPLAANQFIDILLPLLRKKALNSDECVEGFCVIQALLPILGSGITKKILNAVSPLLVFAALDVRLSICNILDGLTANDPSLAVLAKLIRELNAMSSSEIGEFDYDTRVGTYETITPELFSKLSEDHVLVVLSHCVHDMATEELILRQSASKSLLSFVQFSASVLEHASKNGTCVLRIIRKFFLLHLREAMSKEISIQKEWIGLLREMVLKLPGVPELNACRSLCSEDAEVDFFNNILHLQKHRRARALLRFKDVRRAGVFSEDINMTRIFVPLFFNMLLDANDGTGEHVKNACVEALASISGYMHWDPYVAFLMRCFREMTLKPNKQKVLLRLICSVLDAFHFYETSLNQEQKSCDSEVPEVSSTSIVPPEIQTCLQKRVLPEIHKFMTSDSERVNVTISLAALKLLKLLPEGAMDSQLPSIIHRISNFLKNRLESIRDDARSALSACVNELGLHYLHFVIKILQATLKRGFELHVLGYTLNFILTKVVSNPSVGALDHCLGELLSIAENDILGDVAEEKDVDKIASKMKETRKKKSFETLKLVAQNITFKSYGLKLLSPVKTHIQKHLTPKMKARLEMMLHHIGAGIESNPSVDQKYLFIFVYALVEDGIAEENLKPEDPLKVKSEKEIDRETLDKRTLLGSSHLIAVFAIGILHNRFKKTKLDKNDVDLLSMLDPFVGMLGDCLSSKYKDIVSGAVKCLSPLMKLPLPSIEPHENKIKSLVLDIIQKSAEVDSQLMHSSLKLLMVLLQSSRISLSNDQLRLLIQCPLFVDLESNPSIVALSLLKAIIARKLVVPEIYDLVTRVAELMVTSQIPPIRQKCSQILLQFLQDYPIGPKRLQQQLDFLVTNLSYEHSSGREAILEMLHAIIHKFPQRVLNDQAETFFLPLVVRLANDQDNQVQPMVGMVIKELIGHISKNARDRILEYSLSWYMGGKQYLWSAAAQVLGLLVEALKNGFRRHIDDILPVAKNIMILALGKDAVKRTDIAKVTPIPFFKEAYDSLVMLEKVLTQFPELCLQNNLEEMWEAICAFLLHPRLLLQTISNRLVALYFSAASEAIRVRHIYSNQGEAPLLLKPSRLFAVAVSLCCQLNAQLVDDATGNNLITHNLVFAACGVHSFARQRRETDLNAFWSTLDPSERDHFLESLQLLGSRKEMSIIQSLSCNGASDTSSINDQDGHEDLQSLLVTPLFKRMGKVALQMQDFQVKVVLSCFKMISSQIGPEGCHDYEIHLLLPLYKICEGFAGKVITDEVKQLAEEVRDSIRGILGADSFLQTYNLIRKKVKGKRDKRKQEEKIIAVVNPVRSAKRKLRLAAKHRTHKKRKLMTMKMGIWRK